MESSAPFPTRRLFGGALEAHIPARFDDVSLIRGIPDNQEVFSDPASDQSIIFDILEMVDGVTAEQASACHFGILANDSEALQSKIGETQVLGEAEIQAGSDSGRTVVSVTYGRMRVSKFRDSEEKANVVDVYVACFRIERVKTDLLVVFNDPVVIAEGSSSAKVGATVQNIGASLGERSELFRKVVASLKILDFSLFG